MADGDALRYGNTGRILALSACGESGWGAGKSEVLLNQNVKNLIQKLGEAIHESVSESEHIAGVVRTIREEGFDVLLMLEATIGLNAVDGSKPGEQKLLTDGEPVEGPFTNHDLSFLKSLRISLSE